MFPKKLIWKLGLSRCKQIRAGSYLRITHIEDCHGRIGTEKEKLSTGNTRDCWVEARGTEGGKEQSIWALSKDATHWSMTQ